MGVIQSADYFIVNDVSSASVGLYVDTPPVPPMAKQRVTTWQTGMDADGQYLIYANSGYYSLLTALQGVSQADAGRVDEMANVIKSLYDDSFTQVAENPKSRCCNYCRFIDFCRRAPSKSNY